MTPPALAEIQHDGGDALTVWPATALLERLPDDATARACAAVRGGRKGREGAAVRRPLPEVKGAIAGALRAADAALRAPRGHPDRPRRQQWGDPRPGRRPRGRRPAVSTPRARPHAHLGGDAAPYTVVLRRRPRRRRLAGGGRGVRGAAVRLRRREPLGEEEMT